MDYQTYKNRRAAGEAKSKLVGWPAAKVVRLYLPDSDNSNDNGYAYVIQCEPGRYMRTDGYVR